MAYKQATRVISHTNAIYPYRCASQSTLNHNPMCVSFCHTYIQMYICCSHSRLDTEWECETNKRCQTVKHRKRSEDFYGFANFFFFFFMKSVLYRSAIERSCCYSIPTISTISTVFIVNNIYVNILTILIRLSGLNDCLYKLFGDRWGLEWMIPSLLYIHYVW